MKSLTNRQIGERFFQYLQNFMHFQQFLSCQFLSFCYNGALPSVVLLERKAYI